MHTISKCRQDLGTAFNQQNMAKGTEGHDYMDAITLCKMARPTLEETLPGWLWWSMRSYRRGPCVKALRVASIQPLVESSWCCPADSGKKLNSATTMWIWKCIFPQSRVQMIPRLGWHPGCSLAEDLNRWFPQKLANCVLGCNICGNLLPPWVTNRLPRDYVWCFTGIISLNSQHQSVK